MFTGKVAIVTGGAKGIGRAIADMFKAEHVQVVTIDLDEGADYIGDIGEQAVIDDFVKVVISKYGKIDFLINNAMLVRGGLNSCTYDEFNYILRIGVTAPFYLTQKFSDYFNEGASIVNLSSTRYLMSQPDTESYTAAKGGITALTHGLAVSLAGKVKVNAIAPGWIDTTEGIFDEVDHRQQPVGRIGKPEDIAKAVKFLCSNDSGFITGETIHIDGGMTKQMIYHGEGGWRFEK